MEFRTQQSHSDVFVRTIAEQWIILRDGDTMSLKREDQRHIVRGLLLR
jgi:hypothetical protein